MPREEMQVKNPGYWENIEHQKNFLLELEHKLQIKEHREWGEITTKIFSENGGISILNYYGGSIFRLLSTLRPGILNCLYSS